jgi:Phosphotransferase system cellobiose-specific component IIC
LASTCWLSAFIATAGDWKSVILAFVNVIVAFAIYYPFVRMYDNQLVGEELENAETAQA